MKKNLYLVISLVTLTVACGTQKRLTSAKQKVLIAKESISQKQSELESLKQIVSVKLKSSEKDSLQNIKINEVINALQNNLTKIGETISLVELASKSKRNFNDRYYFKQIKPYIDRLDSFEATSNSRERIYQLLSEAVRMNSFVQFNLGTFFDAGVYRIPPSGLRKIGESFKPALDSLIHLSNNYADVKHRLFLVFVGYADGIPINKDSKLLLELSSFYPKNTHPAKEYLNLTLSNLRAGELIRNMKMIVQQRIGEFTDKDFGKISYAAYGRGETLPFPKITDYKENDERRRVVVFYWSVLPDVNN